jgi:hypothetical protein
MLCLYVKVHGYTRVDGADRMNLIKIATLFLFTFAMAACGGGDGLSDNGNDSETSTTGDGTNVTTGTDQSTQVPELNGLTIDVSELAAGGNTQITATIIDTAADNAQIVGTQYGVRFSSDCAEQDPAKASFQDAEVLTTGGSIENYYQAEGCAGNDNIRLTLFETDNGVITGDAVFAVVGSVNVALAEVNNIEYVNASESMIAFKGLGNSALPETSAISFTVKDEFNNPISGKAVTFELSNKSVGVTLAGDEDANGIVEAVTNGDGIAIAYVNSGTTHASISVKATTTKNTGGNISTQSFPVSVTTGVVDQNSFSLVVDTLNPRAWDFDGTEIGFTVRGADIFNNPIPDGTAINFIAESGQIESQCIIAGGSCSVTWASTNPRPGVILDPDKSNGERIVKTNDSAYPGFDNTWQGGRAGVATVLAYTVGEAGFPDSGGNGILDVGEPYYVMEEAYLDANEDNDFDPAVILNPQEKLVDFDSDGAQTPAPTSYQGASCSEAAKTAGHCRSLVHVRESLSFIVADGSRANITAPRESGSDSLTQQLANQGITITDQSKPIVEGAFSGDLTSATCINVADEGQVSFYFNVADINGNIPAVGTKVAFESEGFELVGDAPSAVPNAFSIEGIDYGVTIKADDTFEDGQASIVVETISEAKFSWSSATLTDDPRIQFIKGTRLLDVSTGNLSVRYFFFNACGEAPGPNDRINFVMENAEIVGASNPRVLEIKGTDLTAITLDAGTIFEKKYGYYDIQFTGDGTPDTGNIIVETQGINSDFLFSVTEEITD